jgi:hypothetical protein
LRAKTDLFTINGKPMLVPDQDVSVSYEDLDSSDSGRDESGVMHRFVVRHKVGKWGFSYGHLTEEEKQYMEGLFAESATFSFGHPGRLDGSKMETTTCYRSKYSLSWKNAATGLWSNYNFQIISC